MLRHDQTGMVLIIVLIFLFVLTLLALSSLEISVLDLRSSHQISVSSERLVNTSTPSSVTSKVCSHCADSE